MYLQNATGIDEVITFGTEPAIALMNALEDLEEIDYDEVPLLLEVKTKLRNIQQALNRILEKDIARRKIARERKQSDRTDQINSSKNTEEAFNVCLKKTKVKNKPIEPITEDEIIKFIKSGIFTVDALIDRMTLNTAERDYMKKFKIHEPSVENVIN